MGVAGIQLLELFPASVYVCRNWNWELELAVEPGYFNMGCKCLTRNLNHEAKCLPILNLCLEDHCEKVIVCEKLFLGNAIRSH